ncbi:MAG: hypothetical protein NPIRA04_31640 [Nitrospirales bacterium]|nr:MAG: hypothetical protein NPIRA04_31640 [Nitrospirales bacterium]
MNTTRLNLPSSSSKKQAENKLLWNHLRDQEKADFFTIGYTGRKLEDIIKTLLMVGVRSLLDIRQNPVSMYRPELSKSNFKIALEKRGIHYFHIPALGVPRDIRAKAISHGSRNVIWDWYDQYVASPYLGRNLHHFFNSVEHPVALMCVELDPHECHRHRLCMALEEMGLRGYDL